MSERNTFYITTPIYYPSDRLHIGHAYATTAADAIARFRRLQGYDVMFLTGSDEHGQKIERIAREKGKTPREYVDGIVATFKDLWERLNISYDDFIRTTDRRHEVGVQEVFRRLYENGDIYKDEYEGWYCTPCETFWLERQLKDGKCPDCGRPVELLKEESYFFNLPRYQERLLKHIKEHPEFIMPESRRNEMIRFLEGGLEPLCISRTTFNWGIPVPIDKRHVIYVWIDALSNYITALGFAEGSEKFARYWPADVHLVGKEIVRFHTIIWPAMLMSLGLELPRTVFGHGWLVAEGDKMSKSKGNVVDPVPLIEEFGEDPIRYFLLREIVFGQDGNFSRDALINRINSDLANDLGNLLHRTGAMMEKYFDGVVPSPSESEPLDLELIEAAHQSVKAAEEAIDRLELHTAITEVWRFINRTNKYIDEAAPWALAREKRVGRLQTVMYNLAESLRLTAILIWPFIPRTGETIWRRIGMEGSPTSRKLHESGRWGGMKAGTRIQHGAPLFPRIEVEVKSDEPRKIEVEAGIQPRGAGGAEDVKKREARVDRDGGERRGDKGLSGVAGDRAVPSMISIDDFGRLDLRVGIVTGAEKIEGADKLLKLRVDLGSEERQIVAGIARHYTPDEVIGRRVVVVANLKPARLRGIESQGMLLAAVDPESDGLSLITVERGMKPGSRVQ